MDVPLLKIFQLRVARSTLSLGVRDIGAYINLSRSTISKIENMDIYTDVKISSEQNTILLKIFNDKGIVFPDSKSVSCKNINYSPEQVLTRFQLRGGRSILGLSQRELAEIMGIKKKDLNYLENLDNTSYIPIQKITYNPSAIKSFFEDRKIIFPNNATISLK